VKVPLLVYEPSADSDATRGSVCDELVEAIDLVPTFLESVGADPARYTHRLEGRSLAPFLRGRPPAAWRRYAVSEYDYSMLPPRTTLGAEPRDSRLFMVCDKDWKYVHAVGYRPMLFDLANDRNEFHDLGADPAHEGVRARMAGALAAWGLRLSQRTTLSEEQIRGMSGATQRRGILIGVWDESDIPDELWQGYRGERQ
jgi:arylsulfatase A-like enzyme